MAVSENEFEKLLENFDQAFRDMNVYLEKHEETAMRILDSSSSGGLSSVVQHAPITHRIKKPQRALETLRRRQRERIELAKLKKDVEDGGDEWQAFCGVWHMKDKINETDPFTSVDDMYKAMHDLIGFRISLYFPRDVNKVVDYFTKHEQFEVVVPASRKGGIARDFQRIRKLLAEGEEAYDRVTQPNFAGYKSTHMVVKLKEGSFKHQRHSRGAVIEVQIGTIIMHSWSDIEHDIIYKRLGNRIPSTEERRMLDLINGIVTTGEVALEQLASIEEKTAPAFTTNQLGTYLEKYFSSRGRVVYEVGWQSLGHLLDILKATDYHNYAKLESLIESLERKPTDPDRHLPLDIIDSLGTSGGSFRDAFNPSGRYDENHIRYARYLSTCLVRTVNMALYLGSQQSLRSVADEIRDWLEGNRRPPLPLTEVLDLIHPTSIRCDEARIFMDVTPRIEKILELIDDASLQRARNLVMAGYVACPTFSDETANNGVPQEESIFAVPIFLQKTIAEPSDDLQTHLNSTGADWNVNDDDLFLAAESSNDGNNLHWRPFKRGERWIITKDSLNEAPNKAIFNFYHQQGLEALARCIMLDSTIDVPTPADEVPFDANGRDYSQHNGAGFEQSSHLDELQYQQSTRATNVDDDDDRSEADSQDTADSGSEADSQDTADSRSAHDFEGDGRTTSNAAEIEDQSNHNEQFDQRARGAYEHDQQSTHYVQNGSETRGNDARWQENDHDAPRPTSPGSDWNEKDQHEASAYHNRASVGNDMPGDSDAQGYSEINSQTHYTEEQQSGYYDNEDTRRHTNHQGQYQNTGAYNSDNETDDDHRTEQGDYGVQHYVASENNYRNGDSIDEERDNFSNNGQDDNHDAQSVNGQYRQSEADEEDEQAEPETSKSKWRKKLFGGRKRS